MHYDDKSSKFYSGDRASLYNELLQDSYLTRNVSHLSGIITLGKLKLNIDWHSVTICISLVLNNLIKNRLIGRSNDLRVVLLKGQTSSPYSKIGRHLVLISSRIASSDVILPILPKIPFTARFCGLVWLFVFPMQNIPRRRME